MASDESSSGGNPGARPSRHGRPARSQQHGPVGRGDQDAQRATVVNATLRFGEYATELECSGAGASLVEWRAAAGDCITQIKKWVEANRTQFK